MLHSYSNFASISQHFPYLMCPYSITSIFCTHYVGWCTLSKNLMVLGFFYKTSMCNRCSQFKAFSSYHVGMNTLILSYLYTIHLWLHYARNAMFISLLFLLLSISLCTSLAFQYQNSLQICSQQAHEGRRSAYCEFLYDIAADLSVAFSSNGLWW